MASKNSFAPDIDVGHQGGEACPQVAPTARQRWRHRQRQQQVRPADVPRHLQARRRCPAAHPG
eukprot:11221549-Prorocentrum_lima.AAC.1